MATEEALRKAGGAENGVQVFAPRPCCADREELPGRGTAVCDRIFLMLLLLVSMPHMPC